MAPKIPVPGTNKDVASNYGTSKVDPQPAPAANAAIKKATQPTQADIELAAAQTAQQQQLGITPQQQAAATASGAIPGAFNANATPGNSLYSSVGNDYSQLGLPTSDQEMLAEIGNAYILTGYNQDVETHQYNIGDSANPQSRTTQGSPVPQYQSAYDLVHNLLTMPTAQVKQLQGQLIAGGWLPSSHPLDGVADALTMSAYLKVIQTANMLQSAGNMKTPDQIIGQGAGGGSVTQTTSTVDLTDPETARGVFTSVFQNLTGQVPDSQDLAGFIQALQGYETANPGTTTTTTQYGTGPDGTIIPTKEKSTQKTGGMGSSLSLRGGDVAAAEQYADQTEGPLVAQSGVDTLTKAFSQLVGIQ